MFGFHTGRFPCARRYTTMCALTRADAARSRNAPWSVRDSLCPQCIRHGRDLSCARYEARARCGHQGPAGGVRPTRRALGGIHVQRVSRRTGSRRRHDMVRGVRLYVASGFSRTTSSIPKRLPAVAATCTRGSRSTESPRLDHRTTTNRIGEDIPCNDDCDLLIAEHTLESVSLPQPIPVVFQVIESRVLLRPRDESPAVRGFGPAFDELVHVIGHEAVRQNCELLLGRTSLKLLKD